MRYPNVIKHLGRNLTWQEQAAIHPDNFHTIQTKPELEELKDAIDRAIWERWRTWDGWRAANGIDKDDPHGARDYLLKWQADMRHQDIDRACEHVEAALQRWRAVRDKKDPSGKSECEGCSLAYLWIGLGVGIALGSFFTLAIAAVKGCQW